MSNHTKPSVLVVDDEEEIRSVISAILQSDFQLSAAPKGEVMQASVQGVIAAFGDFIVQSDSQAAAFSLLMLVIASDFTIGPRTDYFFPDQTLNRAVWQFAWNSFSGQSGGNQGGQQWQSFPAWLAPVLTYTPAITLKPNPAPLNYHWKNSSDPIYVPGSSDPGLRWDVVSFANNP